MKHTDPLLALCAFLRGEAVLREQECLPSGSRGSGLGRGQPAQRTCPLSLGPCANLTVRREYCGQRYEMSSVHINPARQFGKQFQFPVIAQDDIVGIGKARTRSAPVFKAVLTRLPSKQCQ